MDNQNLFAQIIDFLTALFSKSAPAPAPQVQTPAPEKEIQPAFTLVRNEFRDDGIFSTLCDKDGNIVAKTLEHSYNKLPKIPNGTWKCVRGPHRLHNMTEDFITFEITGIAGHSDLLFHWGNYNKDSEGCVLMGAADAMVGDIEMITNSRVTFAKFMASLEGVNEFYLKVS